MAFVSELTNKPVSDIDGERLGKLKDLLAVPTSDLPLPKITAIIVQTRQGDRIISISDVAVLIAPAIPLNRHKDELVDYQPGADELYLVRDVLDKQIIDTNGVRVVRVNDLEVTRHNGGFYISNVDIGGGGLMRRLGLGNVVKQAATVTPQARTAGIISWEDVELLAGDQPMRLKVPGEKLAELHPAELAELISDLNRSEGRGLLETLDLETVADTLESVEPDFQASLVEEMANEKVADVLEEMAPDEAADLLAELPEDRSEELLNLMERDDAEDVRRLLTYPVDSAGGLMNTEFVTIRPEWTASQVLDYLRQNAAEAETVYYIYVTNEQNHLEGVFSLRDLVFAKPRRPVSEIMEDRVIAVEPLDTQDECARVISKYNLLAVPVVDQEKVMLGIVTADDALDKIIPTAWKKRLPRMYH